MRGMSMNPGMGMGAAVRKLLPRHLDTRRPRDVPALPAAWRRDCRRADGRRWPVRAHAAEARVPPPMPRACPLGPAVRCLLLRLEHRADVRDCRARPRPEAAAAASRRRRAVAPLIVALGIAVAAI